MIDPLVFGHRVRHYRKLAGMTLDDLGARALVVRTDRARGHLDLRQKVDAQLAERHDAEGCFKINFANSDCYQFLIVEIN